MAVALKSHLFLYTMAFAALCVGSSLSHAAPHVQLDDFYPNCDIRQLNLSQDQRNALRQIRFDYKTASDKAYRKSIRTDRARRQNIIKILSGQVFDHDAARDYVESRYIPSMDFAVDELAIQHRFFKLLSPRQQQQWLSSCLR